jgi:hypothetical protein
MGILTRSLLLLILSVIAYPTLASPLFDEDQVLRIELNGPLSSLVKNKASREERPFQLQVDGVTLDIKVRTRGNSRLRVCTFPPLRLDFRSTDTAETVFANQGKLKLVTQCRNGKRSQQDVLEEYVAYRILTLLSGVSFRVRLVHIAYIDTDSRGDKKKQQYGFFIEPVKQLVARTNGVKAEVPAVSLVSLDQAQAALVYIFQYLIGNTDWSLVTAESDEHCCHNVDLIDVGSKRFLLPYDFDLSGLVNATYARPDPSLRIRKVQQRLYRV